MDFRHLIVTCLFSMLRLPFDNQKVKGNYAIFYSKQGEYFAKSDHLPVLKTCKYCLERIKRRSLKGSKEEKKRKKRGNYSLVISPAKSEFIRRRISAWLSPCPSRNMSLVTAHSGVLS